MRSRVPCTFRTAFVCGFVLASSLISRPASADVISIGMVSFDPYEFGQSNAFSIFNLTGDPVIGGMAFPPDYPVLTSLTFEDAMLRLVDDAGTVSDVDLSDVGPGLLMDPLGAPWPGLTVDAATAFRSATLTATLNASSLLLADGGTFMLASLAIFAELSAAPGFALEPGTFINIDVVGDRVPAPVPEPGTLSLLLVGGLFGAARLRAARSSRPVR
jgi:hypothetical protein